ncbi:hypothetical protein Acsp04_28300 [Actinomadura sp. NBRC 104425]|uniref:hypothetical protein n=1 Tax=Actinomadura sp. NBRC 104425 TaxID=3032204 RepID=UPI00249FB9BF|nr:hypothetical protein [Actinomadura sp. NBRC 104425]GLZ12595.1 hypothetical protein Acsp04_28300 [Actinomadura sp. NBRC 104425]
MPRERTFARRLLISADATGYGRRGDRGQARLQRGLLKVLGEAAERAGLHRAAWDRQVAGDGELAVLPDSEPEPRVVDGYVRQLAAALRRHNRGVSGDVRVRLRLAIHHGTAVRGAESYDGRGVVEVTRLCDSAPLRTALRESGSDLAVILSGRVFHDVVGGEYTLWRPSDFRKVRVGVKELTTEAFLLVPGHDVHSLDLAADMPSSPASERRPGAADTPVVQNNFYDRVDASDATFGIGASRR